MGFGRGPLSPRRWCRGDRGEPAEPPAPPPSRQVRHRGRAERGSGRAGRRGHGVAPRSRWAHRGPAPVAAGSTLRGPGRTQAANQLHAVIDTAPSGLRDDLRELPWAQLVARAARLRPGADLADPAAATKRVLRALALRWQALDAERAQLDGDLEALVARCAPPELLAEFGVGPHTAAALLITAGDHPDRLQHERSFAALCGVSPVDASSGKHQRHRLNRGGDRQANHALWRIVMVRLRWDPATQAYLARRLSEGKTKREAIRCLKRYLARRLWRILHTHHTTHARP